jgi:hypothetical protein
MDQTAGVVAAVARRSRGRSPPPQWRLQWAAVVVYRKALLPPVDRWGGFRYAAYTLAAEDADENGRKSSHQAVVFQVAAGCHWHSTGA